MEGTPPLRGEPFIMVFKWNDYKSKSRQCNASPFLSGQNRAVAPAAHMYVRRIGQIFTSRFPAFLSEYRQILLRQFVALNANKTNIIKRFV